MTRCRTLTSLIGIDYEHQRAIHYRAGPDGSPAIADRGLDEKPGLGATAQQGRGDGDCILGALVVELSLHVTGRVYTSEADYYSQR